MALVKIVDLNCELFDDDIFPQRISFFILWQFARIDSRWYKLVQLVKESCTISVHFYRSSRIGLLFSCGKHILQLNMYIPDRSIGYLSVVDATPLAGNSTHVAKGDCAK